MSEEKYAEIDTSTIDRTLVELKIARELPKNKYIFDLIDVCLTNTKWMFIPDSIKKYRILKQLGEESNLIDLKESKKLEENKYLLNFINICLTAEDDFRDVEHEDFKVYRVMQQLETQIIEQIDLEDFPDLYEGHEMYEYNKQPPLAKIESVKDE